MRTQSLTTTQDNHLTNFENNAGEILDQYTIDEICDIVLELDNMVVDRNEEIENLTGKLDDLKEELKDAENRIDELVYELENLA